MSQITNYDTFSAAINEWDMRTHDTDELIGLAEAEFRLYFGPNYAKETSSTLTFVAGVSALPDGFIRPLSLAHPTGGELTQVSWASLNSYNPFDVSGIPALYAISGASIRTAPLYDGTALFAYEGTLVGLSSTNATNWLITNAPQAYLAMCMSLAKAKFEDFQNAAIYRAQAMQTLYDLGIQSVVAQQGRAAVFIPGSTP